METNAHGQPADPPLALRRPTVSAVICTVDRPVLLRQAIRSIREQRYDGVIETVVVFDGTAPDQSLNSDDAERPVTVMANTHRKGLPGGRNCGAAAATGEYLGFATMTTPGFPARPRHRWPCSRSDPTLTSWCAALRWTIGASSFPGR